jgi:hypothetical protein
MRWPHTGTEPMPAAGGLTGCDTTALAGARRRFLGFCVIGAEPAVADTDPAMPIPG